MKKRSAQKGIIHLPVLLIILAVIGLAIWFFTSKQGLKLPQPSQTSTQDQLTSLKPKPFKDISTDNKNYNAIKYLAREGILEADNNGNFNPDEKLTRVEWAVMLVKLAGVEPDQSVYKNCYADVGEGEESAAICYAKEQGWLGDSLKEQSSILDFVQTVHAQQTKESFNPNQPAKDGEAAGSLSRMMEWEPGKILTDEQALSLAKEKNLLRATGQLTKGGAAELTYRSLATVPFGQEKYTPKADEAVSRQKAANLMDSLRIRRETQAREEWKRVRNSAITNFAEGSGIGYKAATEIVDSSQTRDEALKKVREYRYNQWLTDRTSGGKTLEQADIFQAAQQFVSARGGEQLSLEDVSLRKRFGAEGDKQDTSDSTFSEGQSISMIIPLDKDYRIVSLDQRKSGTGYVRYMLDISAGDLFYWDDQNSGHVFAELINIETGVIENARVSEIDNYKNINEMLNNAVSQIEKDIGREITSPAKSEPIKEAEPEEKTRQLRGQDCTYENYYKESNKCTTVVFNACQDACSEKAKGSYLDEVSPADKYSACMKASDCFGKAQACRDQAWADYQACKSAGKQE